MLIYLVEDDQLKADNIRKFIENDFPELEVRTLGSFSAARRAFEEATPALVVLDMTLPTFDRSPAGREGRLRPLGGYDLMRKMKLKGSNTSVVVVTQLETFGEGEDRMSFSQISKKCSDEFGDVFAGSVFYDASSPAWRESLKEIVAKLLDAGWEHDENTAR